MNDSIEILATPEETRVGRDCHHCAWRALRRSHLRASDLVYLLLLLRLPVRCLRCNKRQHFPLKAARRTRPTAALLPSEVRTKESFAPANRWSRPSEHSRSRTRIAQADNQ